MNALILVIPILLIRYGLLGRLSKEALRRAALFAPLIGREKVAYWVYQITTFLMLILLPFIKIKIDSNWFYIGLAVYLIGIVLYAMSVISYAKPKSNGINSIGLYRISRNPMYIAYFIYFFGGVLLTQSWILLALLIAFQLSSHWIILSEERWCMKEFGDEYRSYMTKVRRYL